MVGSWGRQRGIWRAKRSFREISSLTYWIPFINKESSVLRIILSFNTGV
jgi:hypothetical protein